MSIERLVEELTLERYGPIVRDAERVPHLPLWLYREQWREEDPESADDSAAIEAFQRRRVKQQQRDADARRRAPRKFQVLTDDEIEAAS